MGDVRPTAKWANRMLRPLTSIHHRLEKHNEIIASIADLRTKGKHDKPESKSKSKSARSSPPPPPTTTTSLKAHESAEGCPFSDEEEEINDPAWVPGKQVKRRLKHNYSSRGQRNGARKRSRLTIRSPEVPKTLPGAIEIATPLITGTAVQGREEWSSVRKQLFRNALDPGGGGGADQRRAPRTTTSTWFPAYQGSWKQILDLSGDAGLVDIAHLLDRIFVNFLNNTRAPSGQHSRGARSLLSMTVRRLPEFIAEEQKIQDDAGEEEGDVDMCDAYFTELEAHYAPSGNGWQPLREAVRAQGMRLVSEMMQNGWIGKVATCRLLEECMGHDEPDAFELLLSQYLTTVVSYDYPTSFDPPAPPRNFQDPVQLLSAYYARFVTRRGFVFGQLSGLLARGAIPPEWMVTSLWKRCVDGAVKSLSTDGSTSAAATRLVEAVILSSGNICAEAKTTTSQLNGLSTLRPGRPRGNTRASTNAAHFPKDPSPCPIPIQDALSNLTSSLVSALCGMCIARSQSLGADEKATGVKAGKTVQSLAFQVQRAAGMDTLSHEVDGPSYQAARRGYVLLGHCMLQCGEKQEEGSLEATRPSDPVAQRNIEGFFLSLAAQPDMIKELSEFTQQVFRYGGQMRKCEKSSTPLEVQARVLQLASLTDARGISSLLGKVAAETAMELAEITVDADDHAWALEVQEKAADASLTREQRAQGGLSSPPGSQSHGLYRWEESIGEWIARTPAPKARALPIFPSVAPKANPTGRRPRRPSPVACSTSSSLSSGSPAEESVSSATSSAPSVSVPTKRLIPSPVSSDGDDNDDGPAPPLRKRLRSASVKPAQNRNRNSGRFSTPLDFPRSSSSPAQTRSETALSAPVASRTRKARRNTPEVKHSERGGADTRVGASLTPRVEVVIVNRLGSGVLSSTQTQTHTPTMASTTRTTTPATSRHTEGMAVRTRSSRRASLPAVSREDQPREGGVSPTRRTRKILPVFRPRRTAIPYSSDEDSDDELSFF
ncbi:hypothetical protein BDW42DRAFT_118301 [Aspergillus taichungensis]|uniref:Uncharacterized protein n=1 Tax=Aspergillus taichungensis TaxID=482145 RepID=A0A2J5HS12_9EURO|nr:hypothetical protein BDW42DRAFT_118301 [Aspergillus taichungensis]